MDKRHNKVWFRILFVGSKWYNNGYWECMFTKAETKVKKL